MKYLISVNGEYKIVKKFPKTKYVLIAYLED